MTNSIMAIGDADLTCSYCISAMHLRQQHSISTLNRQTECKSLYKRSLKLRIAIPLFEKLDALSSHSFLGHKIVFS